jgi:hypothetical protein
LRPGRAGNPADQARRRRGVGIAVAKGFWESAVEFPIRFSVYFITMPATIDPEQRRQVSEAIYRHVSRISPPLADVPMFSVFRHLFLLPSKAAFQATIPLLTRLSNFHAVHDATELMLLGHDRQEVCDYLGRPLPKSERCDPDERPRLLATLRNR